MVARVNSAEGGTSGANVTTANSGGTSGDAWDAVYVPSGGSVTFATAAAYKGSRGYRAVLGSASSTGVNLRWSLSGWAKVRARFYVRLSAYPSQSAILAGVSNRWDSDFAAELVMDTSGRLLLVDNADGVPWRSSSALPLNTWLRIEWIVAPGASRTSGTLRVGYASGDAAFTESFASTTVNAGTAGLGNLYLGKLSGVWNATLDLDDLAADDQSATTFLGASAASGTPVVVDPTPPPVVVPPPPPVPDLFNEAIRSSVAIWYTVAATYNGTPVPGANDLRPIGGSITDTTKPGVRRVLNLELAPVPGLFDLLAPIGTTLTVTAHVMYTNRTVVDIPMGVFDIDSGKTTVGGGSISITAPDKWVRIQRARFVIPGVTTPGMLVVDQIAQTIRDALGQSEPVQILATSRATIGAQTWEKDRDKAILEMATAIGAWVYFDRYGVATIADIPTTGADSNYWLIDASEDGVLISLDRDSSRTDTANVVVVSSSATDGQAFPTQIVWDDDPSSPTYAGTDPRFATDVGPFGVVTYYYDTPILNTIVEARNAGLTILARVTGLASQVTLTSVPNPAIDAFDVIDAVTPGETWGAPDRVERHVVDTVSHPLTLDSPQRIDGRSTRSDELVGGS